MVDAAVLREALRLYAGILRVHRARIPEPMRDMGDRWGPCPYRRSASAFPAFQKPNPCLLQVCPGRVPADLGLPTGHLRPVEGVCGRVAPLPVHDAGDGRPTGCLGVDPGRRAQQVS